MSSLSWSSKPDILSGKLLGNLQSLKNPTVLLCSVSAGREVGGSGRFTVKWLPASSKTRIAAAAGHQGPVQGPATSNISNNTERWRPHSGPSFTTPGMSFYFSSRAGSVCSALLCLHMLSVCQWKYRRVTPASFLCSFLYHNRRSCNYLRL